MRIGILTGGGDAPGCNAVIRAAVRKGILNYGYEMFGIRDGWQGLLTGEVSKLTLNDISGILPKGGTILGTSRTNPFKKDGGPEKVLENIKRYGLDCLIAIGGDDTLSVAQRLHEMGIKVVGVPKTIDNDLACTDYTFGFDTAVSIVAEALDRLHTTAESHHRVLVVEVMGRYTGWIALFGGLAGGADFILIPEKPASIEEICDAIKKREERGKTFSIIVVAEGVKINGQEVAQTKTKDEFGHVRLGGIGYYLAEKIEEKTGLETRAIVLGHLQRGGTPTAYDRILATRFGIAAIDLVHEGKFGTMPVLQGDDIVTVPIKDAIANRKPADLRLYDIAKIFFG
ncbi:MAG: ATP-dependent 6-phosphofructokinase [Candidatus Hadarchaeales archaeon]